MNFTEKIIAWYLENKRDLPWRKTSNPYAIWLSEIMLQQTRVAQGLPYYKAFTEKFPTVFDLANATEEQVLKLWQGLGYYSRARNLHATAKFIANDLNGIFPSDYKNLLKLKGVGEYTAAAIASFSYNEVVPVVDGNVFRVLSRYYNVATDIASGKAKKEFTLLAQELISKDNPALFNQAIMEFGALQCVPKNPNCYFCPLNTSCAALSLKIVGQLPVKIKRLKVKNRFLNYLYILDNNNETTINQRTVKGIWHNLYEFPLVETEALEPENIVLQLIKDKFDDISEILLMETETIIHKLTHQHLHVKFWKIRRNTILENGLDFENLNKFPFPIVLHNFIENNRF
ncbi:A/G-specific adenine glycosylase [Flavobacterium psychrophilum]|uniref:A/G-specific adenine glycosylase n=1 Tax=Flavobacterium psychrophilum TaxID=96345 RepID=UPI0004F82B80|nr:A/G-specific adenine glycosylase [Flavobacterium psychrophilum]AIN74552.1 adenine glycosylase [Flavobacterium psychrophilum FPG3]EKT2068310.1 A/G-specific adenine glycosylase [Flavobacterium psychrophilum]EKT2071388.1 A/G-specific adenine glycosylase [Flavobacterium psychrophilum]EKT3962856.1 A/G-specific adenine glycosylase [Flavobacterium psychrophilum]EKT3965016.1 A/G-specific adenine glycosylase [Flavobacterium psychrophilum]